MFSLRKAQDRGSANFGWLDSKHTFSFGSYHDAKHMGFSKLRVINDDTVSPGAGFSTHGHRDMEIISFVTHGVIEHKDSMGNVQSLPKGEFQLMSAGRGVQHSEYNGSETDLLTFLQIWIEPNEFGGQPGYQQKNFGHAVGLTPIITPTGENGTLSIKQDASLSQLILSPSEKIELPLDETRKYYIHQVQGKLSINQHELETADGLKIEKEMSLNIENASQHQALALIFDLPG
ncbi:pirin family protein [Aliiglaciecola lipolytica]|uniref:Pirin-like protein PM1685 n=1 Tax=Aliiglaciecola lipolytica E3 TaxID=1127673 RepID=K6XY95_9ALTE|nr:pirin family protein [Aliiglaciecola lipolytica]GAC16626.1 pirin-like protein PM1685 [Aliiglaciecola lipolytica E3]